MSPPELEPEAARFFAFALAADVEGVVANDAADEDDPGRFAVEGVAVRLGAIVSPPPPSSSGCSKAWARPFRRFTSSHTEVEASLFKSVCLFWRSETWEVQRAKCRGELAKRRAWVSIIYGKVSLSFVETELAYAASSN